MRLISGENCMSFATASRPWQKLSKVSVKYGSHFQGLEVIRREECALSLSTNRRFGVKAGPSQELRINSALVTSSWAASTAMA